MAQMINIIDKQSQNMRELSRQNNSDLEQIRNQYLEKKKATDASWETTNQKITKQDSTAAHNDKHVVEMTRSLNRKKNMRIQLQLKWQHVK